VIALYCVIIRHGIAIMKWDRWPSCQYKIRAGECCSSYDVVICYVKLCLGILSDFDAPVNTEIDR